MQFKPQKIALAVALTALMGGAHATVLTPSSLTDNVDIAATSFGGTLLDFAITDISNASYNGIARTAVYETASGLDFYYQFINSDSSMNGVGRFTGSSFANLGASVVNVFQTSEAFGIFTTGTETSVFADRTAAGVIGFSFVPNGQAKIVPGATSFTQIIRTNATEYTQGNFGLLNGIGDNAAGFATAVPEPETYAMLLAGLGLVGAISRRRKNKAA